MDMETVELFKRFSRMLASLASAFRLQQTSIYDLTVSLQALLDSVEKHDPELAQKYRDAYPVVALGLTNDANLQMLTLIDDMLAQLKQIDGL